MKEEETILQIGKKFLSLFDVEMKEEEKIVIGGSKIGKFIWENENLKFKFKRRDYRIRATCYFLRKLKMAQVTFDFYQTRTQTHDIGYTDHQTRGIFTMRKKEKHKMIESALSYVHFQDGFCVSEGQLNDQLFGENSLFMLRQEDNFVAVSKTKTSLSLVEEKARQLSLKAVADKHQNCVRIQKNIGTNSKERIYQSQGIAFLKNWLTQNDSLLYSMIQKEKETFQIEKTNFFENAMMGCYDSYPKKVYSLFLDPKNKNAPNSVRF